MHTTTIDTPVGPFTIVGRGKAVLASGFNTDEAALTALIPRKTLDGGADDDGTDLQPAIDATRAYFEGDLAAIDTVEVEQRGAGEFLDHAWDVLRAVPAGEIVTYREFAERAGRPAAIRAAASACGRNAAALFVPCHRIVRTDGSLGGYRYGLDIKRWLRAHEGIGSA
jgi:methylated-DNA-[protein]-cysteine S-methyltransferase